MKECQNCGHPYEYVVRKDKKRFQQIIFQCPKCKYKRELLHSEANDFAVWQMTDRDYMSKIGHEV